MVRTSSGSHQVIKPVAFVAWKFFMTSPGVLDPPLAHLWYPGVRMVEWSCGHYSWKVHRWSGTGRSRKSMTLWPDDQRCDFFVMCLYAENNLKFQLNFWLRKLGMVNKKQMMRGSCTMGESNVNNEHSDHKPKAGWYFGEPNFGAQSSNCCKKLTLKLAWCFNNSQLERLHQLVIFCNTNFQKTRTGFAKCCCCHMTKPCWLPTSARSIACTLRREMSPVSCYTTRLGPASPPWREEDAPFGSAWRTAAGSFWTKGAALRWWWRLGPGVWCWLCIKKCGQDGPNWLGSRCSVNVAWVQRLVGMLVTDSFAIMLAGRCDGLHMSTPWKKTPGIW